MTYKKVTVGVCIIVKTLDQSILCGLVEIDHNVTAEDKIKGVFPFYGIHQVKGPEDNIILYNRSDGVVPVLLFYKILFLPCGRKL